MTDNLRCFDLYRIHVKVAEKFCLTNGFHQKLAKQTDGKTDNSRPAPETFEKMAGYFHIWPRLLSYPAVTTSTSEWREHRMMGLVIPEDVAKSSILLAQ